METETVGRVTTPAIIENVKDLWEVETGLRPAGEARRIEIEDALVDTGTMVLSLPTKYIHQLGLSPFLTRRTLTAGGPRTTFQYEAVRLTVEGRICTVDVLEVPEGVPVLIGQVPLELLDLVVDPKGRRLIGNPAHGGEQIFEMY